jgi:hypothetical protein
VNDAILNRITSVFSVTIDGAYAALSVYSIGLLSVLGLIYMLVTLGQVLSGGSPPALGLATMLWTAIKVGVFVWLMTVLYDLMWNGAFMTFLQWGLTASRGAFTVQDFLNPSSVLDAGFRTAGPIYGLLRNMSGPGVLWNWPVFSGYLPRLLQDRERGGAVGHEKGLQARLPGELETPAHGEGPSRAPRPRVTPLTRGGRGPHLRRGGLPRAAQEPPGNPGAAAARGRHPHAGGPETALPAHAAADRKGRPCA